MTPITVDQDAADASNELLRKVCTAAMRDGLTRSSDWAKPREWVADGLTFDDPAPKPRRHLSPVRSTAPGENPSEVVRSRGGRSLKDRLLAQLEPAFDRQFVTGDAIFEMPAGIPAVWGRGTEVLWSEDEVCYIAGPPSSWKSTVVQNVIRARAGIGASSVLGLPVAPEADGKRILYLASDRPSQIMRSLARMMTQADHADILRERLVIWKGLLPFDITEDPNLLMMFAAGFNAGTVVVDSLKDITTKLNDDEVGSSIDKAFKCLLAAGIKVIVIHHTRKPQGAGGKPNQLSDVYGSMHLGAGAGSVIVLDPASDRSHVTLFHRKPPGDEVGPIKFTHDTTSGLVSVLNGTDPVGIIEANPGITLSDIATRLFGGDSRSERQKAERRLKPLLDSGDIVKVDGKRGGPPATYFHFTAAAPGTAP